MGASSCCHSDQSWVYWRILRAEKPSRSHPSNRSVSPMQPNSFLRKTLFLPFFTPRCCCVQELQECSSRKRKKTRAGPCSSLDSCLELHTDKGPLRKKEEETRPEILCVSVHGYNDSRMKIIVKHKTPAPKARGFCVCATTKSSSRQSRLPKEVKDL